MTYGQWMHEFESLVELSQNNPKQACAEVEAFLSRQPQFAPAANLLAYIYIKLKKIKKAERLIEENHQKFPDYLPAKINYGDLCLRKKKLDEIPKIFPSFNLKELYPHKQKFLISEVRAFAVLMGFYHLKMKKRAEAEKFYIQAVEAEPLHPSIALLEKKLFRFKPLLYLREKITILKKLF